MIHIRKLGFLSNIMVHMDVIDIDVIKQAYTYASPLCVFNTKLYLQISLVITNDIIQARDQILLETNMEPSIVKVIELNLWSILSQVRRHQILKLLKNDCRTDPRIIIGDNFWDNNCDWILAYIKFYVLEILNKEKSALTVFLDPGIRRTYTEEGVRRYEHLMQSPQVTTIIMLEQHKYGKGGNDNTLECPCCQKNFMENGDLTTMPCKHQFHSQCLHSWLEMENSCPNCRFGLET
ncbi:hypothetical protein GIB67_039094 [Kingdonia uniflora]|uniref:RING-type domain-containing protein n=1 Tax=Kingdonia uniflora TaxID=39325 RepID=A0A7J7LKW8_9MAGN|nr:hypothetical protein GIB67_039094 [Kingdonia uniflora]